ncbi:MAG: hypothetical protein JSW08_00555 [archaeon]|nr:MAG: hypothetical protein JSW08_00555 [archaeon]
MKLPKSIKNVKNTIVEIPSFAWIIPLMAISFLGGIKKGDYEEMGDLLKRINGLNNQN